MPRGGKRPGAGRPKGPQTVEKELLRAELRRRVSAAFGPLIDAQIANAKGIKYLVVRQKSTGKFLRVSEGVAKALDRDEEIIEVWEKDPAVQAFTDLMNRTIDKPAESVELSTPDGKALVIRWQAS